MTARAGDDAHGILGAVTRPRVTPMRLKDLLRRKSR
jgi:hypothetical protein